MRAPNALKPAAVELDTAAREFAEAHKILAGGSLIEAVRYYAKRHPKSLPRKTVSEDIEEMIHTKTQDGLSYLYINDLKKLRIFAKSFCCPIASVTGPQIDEWLRSLVAD